MRYRPGAERGHAAGTAVPPGLALLGQHVIGLARSHPLATDALLAAAVIVLNIEALGNGGQGTRTVLAVFVCALAAATAEAGTVDPSAPKSPIWTAATVAELDPTTAPIR